MKLLKHKYFPLGCLIAVLLWVTTSDHEPNITLSKISFDETFGSPHIVEGNYLYYLGPWGPCATIYKFRVDGDTIIQVKSYYCYDLAELSPYIPKLIESLRSDDEGTVARVRRFLESVMRMTWPNGYTGYMQNASYQGTPFERGREAGHDEWKQWWEREGEDAFNTLDQ